MIATLGQHGAALQDEQHIVDKWFAPTDVHTRDDHDRWFDVDHGIAYRIRQVALSDGGNELILDSKQHTEADNHNTFNEEELMRGDESAMLAFLASKNYYNWLTIDKKRYRFHLPKPELKVIMDTVAGVKDTLGLDTVLELEYAGNGSRDDALTAIDSFASNLGLQGSTLFDKSLTVESMSVLAKFQ